MIYSFVCEDCGRHESFQRSMKEGPPEPTCQCGAVMDRDWQSDSPHLDTSACRDHNHLSPKARIPQGKYGLGKRGAEREEARFAKHIQQRRRQLADGGNQGSFRHKYSIPAPLYHGKIRETGDRNYWDDPKNLARHSDCRVDQ